MPQSDGQVKLSFAPIVKQVAPSVVNVYSTRIEQQSASPFASDPFFQRFFGGQDGSRVGHASRMPLGSGVIVDGSGIILTNSHVVDGGTEVHISLSDGREFPVDVVLNDSKTDLAVLKIHDPKGETFPALPFANSDDLQVGDLVLAIGNPFGVGQTVTSGIVSALARTGVESNDYEFFIQTDAASIRAIPVARWWISMAVWSASIPPSFRRLAARSALASPFRRTWRGSSPMPA